MKMVWRIDGKETFPPLIPKRELQATTYSYVIDVSLRKGSFAMQKKMFRVENRVIIITKKDVSQSFEDYQVKIV